MEFIKEKLFRASTEATFSIISLKIVLISLQHIVWINEENHTLCKRCQN